jgi:hypothetical protein
MGEQQETGQCFNGMHLRGILATLAHFLKSPSFVQVLYNLKHFPAG